METQDNGPRGDRSTVIRGLEPSDRTAWEQLFRDYIAFYERSLEDAVYEQTWQRLLADREIHGIGAHRGERLIGISHFLVHAHTNAPDVCYLQDLFTAPESRGTGVGRALIAHVTAWARERGCSKVYWQTQVGNERARRLYDQVAEHRGFIVYQVSL